MDDAELRAYYDARAPYYDEAYAGDAPAWVAEMVAAMRDTLRGRHVLELACGTGHWTAALAPVAASITAIDTSAAMRSIAGDRLAAHPRVSVHPGDAYRLEEIDGHFRAARERGMPQPTGGLAMQWLSHVPTRRRAEFLAGWHRCLGRGAAVFLADNQLTPPWEDRLVARPGDHDMYEPRSLPGGREYLIVKNYFTPAKLRSILEPETADLRITSGTRWWWLSYRIA